MEVFGIFSKWLPEEGELVLHAEAMVRVEVWAVVVWNWARVTAEVSSDKGEVVFVVALVWAVKDEVAKPRVPVTVVKVDRRTMESVEDEDENLEEDKVARRNRALVDCIRIACC